jgi:hypothetical protein
MRIGKRSAPAWCLGILLASGNAVAGPKDPPADETVARLIAQLDANKDADSRQKASDALQAIGLPALPALRRAAAANVDGEVKRRIEMLMARIENALLQAEEKHWQHRDQARRGIKDRLVKVLANMPTDRQAALAVYLLTIGRAPTEAESDRARKQFANDMGRTVAVLELARALVETKEFDVAVADVNSRLLQVQQDVAAAGDVTKQLLRLNDPQVGKLATDAGAALSKSANNDKQLVNQIFLTVLSRLPSDADAAGVSNILKRAKDRAAGTGDIVSALMNGTEFSTAR